MEFKCSATIRLSVFRKKENLDEFNINIISSHESTSNLLNKSSQNQEKVGQAMQFITSKEVENRFKMFNIPPIDKNNKALIRQLVDNKMDTEYVLTQLDKLVNKL